MKSGISDGCHNSNGQKPSEYENTECSAERIRPPKETGLKTYGRKPIRGGSTLLQSNACIKESVPEILESKIRLKTGCSMCIASLPAAERQPFLFYDRHRVSASMLTKSPLAVPAMTPSWMLFELSALFDLPGDRRCRCQ